MGSKAILYRMKRFGKRLTSPQQWSLKDLIPHGMLSIMITILKRCTKNCYFFIVIFPLLSQSKNDQKCIVYPSHADILLQHYIISPLGVRALGKKRIAWRVSRRIRAWSLVVTPYWRAPKRAKQLSVPTIPLCFGFFRYCVDVLQSWFSRSTISIAVFCLQNLTCLHYYFCWSGLYRSYVLWHIRLRSFAVHCG